jgi:hypothetical protein
MILSHTDTWDAITNNEFLSIEGLVHVVRQVRRLQGACGAPGEAIAGCMRCAR